MKILRPALFPVSLFAMSIAISSPANAQQAQDNSASREAQDDDFHTDKEIVVTAPYVERLDILSGTSALSGENLAAEAQGQIGDILTSLPGVSATSFSPGASRPVLRGFQGNRVAVLTDGIGNIDASNTSADHAVTIDALTTERIEVLRGPAVLLFGGQAVGGAVNVIDKRIPRSVPTEAVHIDALLGYSTASNIPAVLQSIFPSATVLSHMSMAVIENRRIWILAVFCWHHRCARKLQTSLTSSKH
jgi:iron complex outermembrane recepter protein